MTLVDHANSILDCLIRHQLVDGRIQPISNLELLRATRRQPADYAVVYGQANSLLDIASLESGLPLIGRLIEFDRRDEEASAWAAWKPFESLLYYTSPRLKCWTSADVTSLKNHLPAGSPSIIWKGMEAQSGQWLGKALQVAQTAIHEHAERLLQANVDRVEQRADA